jgi:hypothetical protein
MSALRRGSPASYRPMHAPTVIAPGGATWTCGKCGKRQGSTMGRFKHRVFGFCCAACKPAPKG